MGNNMMKRDIKTAAGTKYDVIVVGGGIYGAALVWNAVRMGLRVLLVEKGDFGSATTFNHLRTVHGGLRYLQSLDMPRFFESTRERRWFMKMFPSLTRPLPCLMPLYGNGPYRPSVFHVALGLNNALSCGRNAGVQKEQQLDSARVISAEEVVARFPLVDRDGLKGGAVWYDGGMPSPQLVIMALLNNACEQGATALNYLEGTKLLEEEGRVRGLRCRDNETGSTFDFQSDVVINATGPWCREFAASFSKDDEELFRYSIAWNVLFNRKPLSTHSLALKAKRPGSRMYFVHGFHEKMMAGTIHAPMKKRCDHPVPGADEVAAYIDDLNLCVPGLHLKAEDVQHIYAGMLPVQVQGSVKLAARAIVRNHGENGGPQGAWSVSGVKFTTARLVAEKMLQQIFSKQVLPSSESAPIECNKDCLFPLGGDFAQEGDSGWKEQLQRIIEQQAVVHLDDLLLRRTTIGDNPQTAVALAEDVCQLFNWDGARKVEELERVKEYCKKCSLLV